MDPLVSLFLEKPLLLLKLRSKSWPIWLNKVTISGKPINSINTDLGSIDVDIPKEHHRFVLGKGAEVLKRIQDQTGAKISVPKADEKDGLIRVTGSKEAMDAAKVSFCYSIYML